MKKLRLFLILYKCWDKTKSTVVFHAETKYFLLLHSIIKNKIKTKI